MSFKKLVDEAMLAEKSPPGFKGTVKAMKDEGTIDNPYALAWWMKNKGYKSHKKADGSDKESIGEARRRGVKANFAPFDAYGFLNSIGALGQDFHALRSEQVDAILAKAKEVGYRKSRSAPGSTARMFFQSLSRMAEKVNMPAEEGFGDGPFNPHRDPGRDQAEFRARMQAQNKARKDKAPKKPKRESVRVEHPVHGKGTVEEIAESTIEITWDNLDKRLSAPNVLPFDDAKYLTRLSENQDVWRAVNWMDRGELEEILAMVGIHSYDEETESDDELRAAVVANVDDGTIPAHVVLGESVKKPMKRKTTKKKKVTESVVATAMAPVQGTHRGEEELMVDDILRFEDLLSEDDDWNKPWENDDDDGGDDDRSENMDGDQHGLRDAEDTRDYPGADYTNVPRPSDSVLTNQEDQPAYHADPLATMAGYDAAPEGLEPEGDYETDLKPVDAPDTPQVRDEQYAANRGNTRDAGDDSDDTSEVSAGDYDESKPEDTGGEDEMSKKNESAWLDADDLGLELNEMSDPMGGMDFDMAECPGGMGMEMAGGMGAGNMAAGPMGEHAMGAGEVAFTKEFLHTLLKSVASQSPDEAKLEALCQGLQDAQSQKGDAGLDVGDWDSIKSAAASAYNGGGDDMGGDMGGADDLGDDGGDYDAEFEDKAEGDGEEAGPEGGPEHEGKTKMMDQTGDVSVAENSGTPIGTGNTSGSGGGSQKDLSKPKAYHGKPVGTGTSGPGGSSADEFGQEPKEDGGSNLLPAYEKGKQNGAHGTNFDGKAESPAPRRSKPLAAEDAKKASNKKKLDEHIMLGMSAIQGTIRDDGNDVPEDADWDDELATIRRRAGMEDWWKKD